MSEIAASASAAPRFARPASADPSEDVHDDVPSDGSVADAAVWKPEASSLGFGSAASSRSNRKKPAGVIGPMIGVVLGGVVGISLGYVILIWFAGRTNGDVLHVLDRYPVLIKYLPGADR